MKSIKAIVFKLIRPMFVKNIDPREDYECVMCGEPVLLRYLTCSKECSEKFGNL
jgi:hypothetical protein